jgi:hypothetical protein
MKKQVTALLTTAIVTGMFATQMAKAEDAATPAKESAEQVAPEKANCKGMKAEDKMNCNAAMKMKKKKGDKSACKSGCGEAKMKKGEAKTDEKIEEKVEAKKE